MLKDWLSAFFITALVVLEIGGWAWVLNHFVFARKKDLLPSPIATALAVILGAHFFFLISFFGLTWGVLHWGLALGPAAYFAVMQFKQPLHLNAARFFSLLAWKKRGPWIFLILVWFFLKTLDALMPLHEPHALSWNLLSVKLWFEDKTHLVQALHPASLAGTIWEGWYYHILCLLAPLGHTWRQTLVRTQISAQLFLLSMGIALLIFLLAELVQHLSKLQTFTAKLVPRHGQLRFSVCLALAWVAVASHLHNPLSPTAVWGAPLFFVTALVLCTLRRFGLAAFSFASGIVIWPKLVAALPIFLAVLLLFSYFEKSEFRKRPYTFVTKPLAGFLLGFAPLFLRNFRIDTPLFFPLVRGHWETLGWFTEQSQTLHSLRSMLSWVLPYQIILATAVCFCVYWVLRWGVQRVSVLPRGTTIFVFAFFSLIFVRMPFHLVWQNLPYAFLPTDAFLTRSHPGFEAALWANLHFDASQKIAWTDQNEFYYVDAKSAATNESALLFTALQQEKSPLEKAHAICNLGFSILAWKEYHHGPEVNGLARWLQIQDHLTSHAVQETHFFDLAPLCQRPL